MIKGDATTNKLMSPLSVWKSHRPNSFKKAIELIDSLMDSLDEHVAIKAAITTIEHHKGKPNQSVDLSNSDETLKPVVPIIVQDQKTADLVKNIMSGTLKRQ